MPRLTGPTAAGVAGLLPYANTILGAVRSGGSVSDIWAAVRQAEANGGPLLGSPSIFDMNFVAGQARAILSAEYALANAAPSDAVTSEMWAWAPWATAGSVAWGEPQYQIRYGYEVQNAAGESIVLWGQTDWQGSLEGPVSRVYDRVTGSAGQQLLDPSPKARQALGTLEGSTLMGVQNIQILRV